jgi:hypothetical protein
VLKPGGRAIIIDKTRSRQLPRLLSNWLYKVTMERLDKMVLPEGVPLRGAVADILVRAAEAAKPLCPRGDPLFRWARGRASRTSPRTVVQARSRTASRCGMVLSEMKDITIAEHPRAIKLAPRRFGAPGEAWTPLVAAARPVVARRAHLHELGQLQPAYSPTDACDLPAHRQNRQRDGGLLPGS